MMLFSSSDEKVGAILQQYKDAERQLEKNLIMISVKTEGHVSLDDVYNMPFLVRELYIEAQNEYTEEQNKKMKG